VPTTADFLDDHGDAAHVCLIQFCSFGEPSFEGAIATVRCDEDNVLVREHASQPGAGRVLVIDGAGSMRCALLGDSIGRSRATTAGPGSSSTAAFATPSRWTSSGSV
jgi:regulator of ribonuclease activity A